MRKYTRLLAAVLLIMIAGTAWGGTITDELNPSKIGYYDSYTEWSGLNSFSYAEYKGNTKGVLFVGIKEDKVEGKYTGIITTTSGGVAKEVEVEWSSSTTNGVKLYIYGKLEPYTDVSDLFDDKKQGTLLGTIEKGKTSRLTGLPDSTYIGIRAEGYNTSKTAFLTDIRITWEHTGYPVEISDVAISFPRSAYYVLPKSDFEAPKAKLAGVDVSDETYTSSNTYIATVDEDGDVTLDEDGTEGTTTIQAVWGGNGDEAGESTATYKLVVTGSVRDTTWNAIDHATAQGYPDKKVLGTETDSTITITFDTGSGTQSPQYRKIDNTVKKICLYDGNTLTFVAPTGCAITYITVNYERSSGYNEGVTPSVGDYNASGAVGNWEGISQYVTLTNTSEATLNPISFTITYIALEEEETVTITDAGVGTYCPTKNVVVGDGTLSTIVKGVDGSNILIEEPIYAIPAGTGVLLTGTPGTYKVYAYDGLLAEAPEGNLLVGVTEVEGRTAPTNTYVLQKQGDVVAFYKVVTDNIKVPAKRAYLYFPSGAPSAFYIRERGAVVTGMEPTPAMQNGDVKEWFTISGTKATPNQKGFLIGKRPDGTTIKVLK